MIVPAFAIGREPCANSQLRSLSAGWRASGYPVVLPKQPPEIPERSAAVTRVDCSRGEFPPSADLVVDKNSIVFWSGSHFRASLEVCASGACPHATRDRGQKRCGFVEKIRDENHRQPRGLAFGQ
jgi:hypothetical protein